MVLESKILIVEEIVGVIKCINLVLCYLIEFLEIIRFGFVGEI